MAPGAPPMAADGAGCMLGLGGLAAQHAWVRIMPSCADWLGLLWQILALFGECDESDDGALDFYEFIDKVATALC